MCITPALHAIGHNRGHRTRGLRPSTTLNRVLKQKKKKKQHEERNERERKKILVKIRTILSLVLFFFVCNINIETFKFLPPKSFFLFCVNITRIFVTLM